MTEQLTPEGRVRAFMSDWFEQWQIMRKDWRNDAGPEKWEEWASLVRPVDRRHFAKGRHSNTANSFGPAEFDPSNETFVNFDIVGDVASVETTKPLHGSSDLLEYKVYELVGSPANGWLISGISTFTHPPDNPMVPEAERDNIIALTSADAELSPIEDDLAPDAALLFTPGRSVTWDTLGTDVTSVETLGMLHTGSGVLSIQDFGYDVYDYKPLERSIAPGKYVVEAVRIFNAVAAIRVVFDDKPVVNYRAAAVPGGNGVVGVDAGNIAIVDAVSFMQLSYRNKERIFGDWFTKDENGRINPKLITMVTENDGVLTESGMGDGGYPCYWGLDGRGEVVCLIVDFMLLGEEIDGVFTTQ